MCYSQDMAVTVVTAVVMVGVMAMEAARITVAHLICIHILTHIHITLIITMDVIN